MVKTIRQSVTFKASPHEVFEALLDERKHSEFSGGEAKVSRVVGGRFSVFDGYATGKNLKIVKDKLIEQSWRNTDFNASDEDSVVRFELKQGKSNMQTLLSFTHEKVPDRLEKELAQGWKDFYWAPMKGMLEGK